MTQALSTHMATIRPCPDGSTVVSVKPWNFHRRRIVPGAGPANFALCPTMPVKTSLPRGRGLDPSGSKNENAGMELDHGCSTPTTLVEGVTSSSAFSSTPVGMLARAA